MGQQPRWHGPTLASVLALAVTLPPGAHAQVGALGAAAALGAQGENVHAGAPVFTESARVHEKGRFSVRGVGGYTTGSVLPGQVDEEGWTVFQLFASGFVAPVANLTVGAIVPVVNSISFDNLDGESGFGDVSLYGKYRLGGGSATDIAAIGQVTVPTAKEGFGLQGLAFAGGLAVSRQLSGGSLHAAGVVSVPTDDLDGDPVVNLSAAGVLGIGERIGLAAEGSLSIGTDTFLDAGPAIRIRTSDNVFIDGGLIFSVVNPVDELIDVDAGLLIGVTIGG